MTLFDLIKDLRALGDMPILDISVELVKVEADSVVVRLKGNRHLGRVLQSSPKETA